MKAGAAAEPARADSAATTPTTAASFAARTLLAILVAAAAFNNVATGDLSLRSVGALRIPAGKSAAPLSCVVTAGARTFNLAELGGGGGAATVRYLSTELDSHGCTFSFSACGDVAPDDSAGGSCAAVPPSAVLRQTEGDCAGLGASSTRAGINHAYPLSLLACI